MFTMQQSCIRLVTSSSIAGNTSNTANSKSNKIIETTRAQHADKVPKVENTTKLSKLPEIDTAETESALVHLRIGLSSFKPKKLFAIAQKKKGVAMRIKIKLRIKRRPTIKTEKRGRPYHFKHSYGTGTQQSQSVSTLPLAMNDGGQKICWDQKVFIVLGRLPASHKHSEIYLEFTFEREGNAPIKELRSEYVNAPAKIILGKGTIGLQSWKIAAQVVHSIFFA